MEIICFQVRFSTSVKWKFQMHLNNLILNHTVSKEGNVNIWNLKTTELVKTIQSQAPSSRYEISYAEVPIIDLSVDSKMFYSINNEIYIYDF